MVEIYDKIVFLSEEAEKEWNEATEAIKKTTLHLLKKNIAETQWKIEKEMECKMLDQSENHFIEFWRRQAHDYEYLYKEQKDICEGYKKIIDEYRLILGLDNNLSLDEQKITKNS